MKVLIHACPQRMWYVDEFLKPSLIDQGADEVKVWCDTAKHGILEACMESFETRTGDGGTWHIQDDVLICRDFVKRCRELDEGVVYGFCCTPFTDDPGQTGLVYVDDSWHSFQCVRIPDSYALECAEWYRSGRWVNIPNSELPILQKIGKGDDTFFRIFLMEEHKYEMVRNVAPNLVEHVDWIVGGSTHSKWRDFVARSDYWDDEDLVEELRIAVKGKVKY